MKVFYVLSLTTLLFVSHAAEGAPYHYYCEQNPSFLSAQGRNNFVVKTLGDTLEVAVDSVSGGINSVNNFIRHQYPDSKSTMLKFSIPLSACKFSGSAPIRCYVRNNRFIYVDEGDNTAALMNTEEGTWLNIEKVTIESVSGKTNDIRFSLRGSYQDKAPFHVVLNFQPEACGFLD